MEQLTDRPSPKENSTQITNLTRGSLEVIEGSGPVKPYPSSAIPNSRNSPLSWQQRPNTQASDQPRSRPLSIVATENATRSSTATLESSAPVDEQPPASRYQISQLLSSKDPAWFRQTAERGEGSPAYRKSQVEDNNVVDMVNSSRIQLPGMASGQSEKTETASSDEPSTELQTDVSSTSVSIGKTVYGKTSTSRSIGSPLPLISDHRLDPPKSDSASYKSDDAFDVVRSLAMSPSQGRISPERLDRSISPTKGMGGFVQSAMMKRSDSVSKRWSVQSPQGLSRGNSMTSNRSSHDSVANVGLGGVITAQTRESCRSSLSRDNSPLPLSRPTSSHSNATVVQDSDRPGTSSSLRSSTAISISGDGFTRPSLPFSRPHNSVNVKDGGSEISKDTSPNAETTPPPSPSKVTDNRRWSPTKSSWLESALNKPDSPKPKVSLPPPQPSWMSEINKVKQQKAVAESSRGPPVFKHEVNIGGLLRYPLSGAPATSLVTSGLSSGNTVGAGTEVENRVTIENVTSPISPEALQGSTSTFSSPKTKTPLTPTVALSPTNTPSIGAKVKPEAPPKTDFRSNLRPRQVPSDGESKQEPEFKNVFSQLRRTKTQNYVAPDELKDNILRGKAALNVTGGPKKTEHKDEFKDAILKKKEDFRKAQLEGTGVIRNTSSVIHNSSPLPEALAKKASIGKIPVSPACEPANSKDMISDLAGHASGHKTAPGLKLTSAHDIITTGRPSNKETGGKLAERFNPSLASLLARGPPLTTPESARASSPAFPQPKAISNETDDLQASGPQLTHLTKDRVRGPRKKAPTTLTAHNQALDVIEVGVQGRTSIIPSLLTGQTGLGLLSIIPDTGRIVPKFLDGSENESVRASPVGKNIFSGQSPFSGGVLSKDEEATQHLGSYIPRSPIKEAKENELLTSNSNAEPVVKTSPTIKPKPSSLIRSSDPDNQINIVLGSAFSKSPGVADTHQAPSTPKNYPRLAQNTTTGSVGDEKLPAQRLEAAISTPDQNSFALLNSKATLAFSDNKIRAEQSIKPLVPNDEEADRASTGPQSSRAYSHIKIGDTLESATGKGAVPHSKSSSAAAPTLISTHPLPASPPVSGVSLQTSSITPVTPRNVATQPVPQSSEASRLVTDFFGKKVFVQDFDFDTSSILLAKTEQPPTIKTLRSQLFQITGDGKKQQVPSHQERLLFQSNMYICPHTFGTLAGKKVIEVYFWAGDDVPESSIDDAELFAQREARNAGGKLVKMRQGKETAQFIEALGGIMITRRGSSNKYDSLAPHILCGRRYTGQIVFDEVDFSPKSLCSGFPYLISTQSGKCYLWKGRGSSIDELSCARLIGMDFGITGEVEEVEDGHEPDSFLKIFGYDAAILKSADHWRLKPNYEKYSARLFRADSSRKPKVCSLLTHISPGGANIF